MFKKPKLFLKGNVKDIHVFAYMKELVTVCQANCDIQYVLEICSCVIYIDKSPKVHENINGWSLKGA